MFQFDYVEYCDTINTCIQLQKIKDGIIPGVVLKNVYSQFDCESTVRQLQQVIPDHQDDDNRYSSIGFGLTEFKSIQDGKKSYFEEVQASQKKRDTIFESVVDPIYPILSILSSWKQAIVPTDPAYKQLYSHGVIETQIHGRRIHVDNIPTTQQQNMELSIVLYLQSPEQGGELEIYQKRYEANDGYEQLGEGGITESEFIQQTLSDYLVFQYTPVAGDLLIFANCWYHRVLPSVGVKPRIAHLTTAYEHEDRLFVYV
jgi:hypothetical protein